MTAEVAPEQAQEAEDSSISTPLALREVLTEADQLAVFTKLEELKLRIDADTAEFNDLKLEAGSIIAVAGGTSGAYGQIVVALIPGGATNKFEPDRLLTTPLSCPHCAQQHFYPAGMLAGLYSHSTKRDSVSVSIAGSKGRKRRVEG